MGEAIFIVAVAIGSVAWWLRDLQRQAAKSADMFADSLERSCRELGIQLEPRDHSSRAAVGTVGDTTVQVSLESRQDQDENPRTYLVVSADGPRIPRGLRFAAERDKGDDVLTGDPVFDDIVEVHGQPSVVLALLKKDVRQKVAVFVASGGRLESGRLICRNHTQFTTAEIPAALRMTVRLAEDLSSSEDGGICQRLAHNALSDPVPGVRLWNLLQLHEVFPATDETREASRAALADSSAWVRLSAARFLGDEGLEVLESIARDRKFADQAVEAVALLAARLPLERAGPLLVDVLKSRTGDARRKAVEELGRLRYAPALGPLIVVMERAEARDAAAAAAALGALGDPRAESSLLKSVESEPRELQLAAARALGSLGSVRSVPPLLALLDSRRLDAAGRQCVRYAVAGIQSRLVGAGAGQLSIAASASESGRLSLAKPRSGAGDLSLASESEDDVPR